MQYKAVAFTGPSNSGKTTLIERIASYLIPRGRKVAVIKNDPKDKAEFDRKGKDSERFYRTGADVAVLSPTRTTLFSHRSRTLEESAELLAPFDLLMVEGLRTLPLPRIAVFRHSVDPDYLPHVQAIALPSDRPTPPSVGEGIERLNLDDMESIISWIDEHARILAPKPTATKGKQC